jgi:hypothetical protein
MTLFARITLIAYFGIFCYCLGKFTYWDADGYGFFVNGLGGYHVSTLGEF